MKMPYEKVDESMEQGIIVPVEEPTNWVSSLENQWKLQCLPRLKRCQQSHQEKTLQYTNSRREYSPAVMKQEVHPKLMEHHNTSAQSLTMNCHC